MNALLRSLIIFLYPAQCRYCGENLDPSDGHYICESCWQQMKVIDRPYCEICGYPYPDAALSGRIASCRECPGNLQFRKVRSVTNYDSAVGEAVRLLKYQGKTIMAKPLAELMVKNMPRFFGMEDYDYIIPVPIHKRRRRKRGYNQMELIGRWLSHATGIPMETRSLIKIKDIQMVGLPREKRVEEIKDAFDIPDPSGIAGKRVLLIDDVLTSGSTANESSRILAKKGRVRYVDVFTLTRQMK